MSDKGPQNYANFQGP